MYRGTVFRLSLAAGLLLTLALGFACSGGGGGGVIVPVACGNGLVDAGEQCDDGAANSDVVADACRTTCLLPTCGDSVQDTGEQCDDGNTINGDGCEACVIVPVTLTASFTPANPAPGSSTINMTAGAISNDLFDVQIRVKDIDDFYGAAFRVYYDPLTAEFVSETQPPDFTSPNDSFIFGFGFGLDFRAVLNGPGEVLVVATRQGQIPGVPASLNNELLTSLRFRALAPTAGNTFSFDTPGSAGSLREVQTCDSATNPCIMVNDATLTWSGGTMTAN